MGISAAAQNHKTADLTELVGTQLFKQVSMAQVASLLRFCPTLTLAAGDKLIVPGQTADKVHILLQGRLQVFDGEPDGKPVGEISRGECVGLSSFIDRQPCHVSIVSAENCRLLALDEERLLALINTPTVVSRNLLFLLMKYLREKVARTAVSAAPPAPAPEAHNHIDAVTGLHNQRWLDDTLDRLILRAATDCASLSLVAIDLFDLPGLTGQHGQETVNASLREIAKILGNTIRPTDLIARHTSGRFVVMLPGTDPENAKAVAARIEDAVHNAEIVIPGVCILPPMKIVIGAAIMKAFVSSRKLVDDALAALERNRAIMIEAMATPAVEALAEPPSPDSDTTSQEAAQPSTAALDNSASETTADTLSENAYSYSPAPESAAGIEPETPFADSDSSSPPEAKSDDPPHLIA